MSSSTANLIELLSGARKLVRDNDHISWLYIFYQALQLVSIIFSPGMVRGTVFRARAGNAINSAKLFRAFSAIFLKSL